MSTILLRDACAASSSFLAAADMSPAWFRSLEPSVSNFSLWTANFGGQKLFDEGQKLFEGVSKHNTKETLKEAASASLVSLVDGGYVDNTGIANAIAAGKRSIVVFLQNPEELVELFSGGDQDDGDELLDIIYFSIFQEGIDEAKNNISSFLSLALPSYVTVLKGLRVGTLQATLKRNYWMGIPPQGGAISPFECNDCRQRSQHGILGRSEIVRFADVSRYHQRLLK